MSITNQFFLCQVRPLQRKVFHLLSRQPTMGQQIPEAWVHFEKIITSLVDRGIIYAKVEEVRWSSSVFEWFNARIPTSVHEASNL